MAQSALTVTPPSPTPPTNMSFTGATLPNPPNFTRGTYADWLDNTRFDTLPPPYFDDGAAGSLYAFATNTAALASGTSAADNNTGTTPGTNAAGAGGTGFNSVSGTYPGAANGTVPASTSVPHEGAGTEQVTTYPGNLTYTYPGGGTFDTSKSVRTGPDLTAASIALGPNGSHASTLSPAYASNPAFASLTVGSSVSGTGTTLLTCTGTNFVPGCRIWVNNVEQTTTYVSATSLTATIAKKAIAGTWPVDVKLGGVAVPSTRTITWT